MAKRAFTIDTGKEKIEVEGHEHKNVAIKYLMKRRRSLLSTKDPTKVELLFADLPVSSKRDWEAADQELQGVLGTDGHGGILRSALHVHHGRSLTADERRRQKTRSKDRFRANIVATILDSNPERALDLLCEHYRVERPKLGVGVVKGRSKGVLAVYSARRKEILAAKREYLYDPFTILHEFYHHLRQFAGEHRGTEKYADRFAIDFIVAYQREAKRLLAESSRNPD